jgi:Fe-S-cluster-containing dehydrogenase component
MPTLDPATGKASKCDLCGGAPECVAACPTGSLSHIPWRDLTRDAPILQAGVGGDCGVCHKPGGGTP